MITDDAFLASCTDEELQAMKQALGGIPGASVSVDAEIRRRASAPGAAERLEHVLCDVRRERASQDAEHGGAAHDDTHTFDEWAAFIRKQLARAESGARRERLVKVAALAVAAVEAIDRTALTRRGA